jgi:nitrite reductase/ring-hydroxylating ferredoxin subunit
MITGSKIRYFLISLLIGFQQVSCERNENDVIPDVYVDFTMSLNDIEFVSLTSMFGSVYVSSNTNNWGLKAAGYDGNGIIVFAGPNDEFYAYDRTCPHDYYVNKLSVKVNVVDIIYAECPQCKTRYALTNLGTPVTDTIGRYPLKNYRTSSDGLYIRVWNY